MSYYDCVPDNESTKTVYGHNITDLNAGSHERIIVKCTNCNELIHRENRYINDKHQCSIIKDGKKRCFKCGEWRNFSFFPKNPSGTGGVGKLCKDCFNSHPTVKKVEKRRLTKRKTAHSTDFYKYMGYRLSAAKSRAKKKKIEFNLDTQFLIDLWSRQNGRCYYSGILMKGFGKEYNFQLWDSPSLDRKNPKDGYTKNNTVWTVFGINSFKQSLTEKEFQERVNEINWNFLKQESIEFFI